MSNKRIIHTDKAPAAIGSCSQAVKVGTTVYLSGQIPLEPETMEVVDGDFTTKTHQVFKNLQAVAEAAGGSLQDAAKITIFLTDLDNFALVNEVMTQYFEQPYPARAAVGVQKLPKNVNIEIEAILELS